MLIRFMTLKQKGGYLGKERRKKEEGYEFVMRSDCEYSTWLYM